MTTKVMTSRELSTVARKYVGRWRREKAAEEQRREAAPELIEAMSLAGVTVVPLKGEVVYFVSQVQRRCAKDDVVRFFGAERAEEFWGQLPETHSEYLTVRVKSKEVRS